MLAQKWQQEQKEAVELNFKILADAFKQDDTNMRQQAISCGFINRILERLSAVSGEKPREFVEDVAEEEELEELPLAKKQSSLNEEKMFEARTKKKRGGVGYTAVRHGEAKFDVGAYLENKKQRNEQIKVLIDICTGFFNSEEW